MSKKTARINYEIRTSRFERFEAQSEERAELYLRLNALGRKWYKAVGMHARLNGVHAASKKYGIHIRSVSAAMVACGAV